MIILTGGAGFVGTNLLDGLNAAGETDILVVDDIGVSSKWSNLVGRRFRDYVPRDGLWDWIEQERHLSVDAVLHFGACSDTRETDFDYLFENNVRYSQRLWNYCTKWQASFIYASSAATYGSGEYGFNDDHAGVSILKPLNRYGFSKQLFDLWTLGQSSSPPFWAGLKLFNVYGPHEEHKGSQASMVYQATRQVMETEKVRLFRSLRQDVADGEQRRDFVYVLDVVKVVLRLIEGVAPSGLYNIGTGKACTFNQLAEAVFDALEQPRRIEYIDMPKELAAQYQDFTEARMDKLASAGIPVPATQVPKGVQDYMGYLVPSASLSKAAR